MEKRRGRGEVERQGGRGERREGTERALPFGRREGGGGEGGKREAFFRLFYAPCAAPRRRLRPSGAGPVEQRQRQQQRQREPGLPLAPATPPRRRSVRILQLLPLPLLLRLLLASRRRGEAEPKKGPVFFGFCGEFFLANGHPFRPLLLLLLLLLPLLLLPPLSLASPLSPSPSLLSPAHLAVAVGGDLFRETLAHRGRRGISKQNGGGGGEVARKQGEKEREEAFF